MSYTSYVQAFCQYRHLFVSSGFSPKLITEIYTDATLNDLYGSLYGYYGY